MARTKMVIGFVAALLALTACGGNDTDDTDSVVVAETAAPVATQAADPTVEAPADDAVGIVPVEIAACDLLTADEVAAATGLDVFEVRDDPPIDCIFDLGDEAGVEVWVTIEDGQGRFAGPANLFKEYMLLEESGEVLSSGPTTVVANVGERAVCCPFRAIAVDAGGGRFIAVSVGGGYNELAEPRDALISLANTALERLG